jgi:Sulfotransferase family
MQRVFIVGCPRSGTTLLQSLLTSHPAITSFPETQFFLHLWGEDLSRTLHERLMFFFCEDINRPDLLETMQPYQTVVDRVAWFVGILDQLATEEGNDIWLEKTPQHLFFIEDIALHLPDAKFIDITREPLDTIASLYLATRMPAQRRSWGEPWSLEKCVTMWKRSARISNQYAQNNPQHLTIKYEELTANIKDELTKCCEFIGLEYSPLMLGNYKSKALELGLGLPWHNGNDRDIAPSTSNYKQVFQDHEIAYILARIGGP